MIVAAHGLPSATTFSLIVLAMVSARTAAMLFNRIADWDIDQRNPRTAARHELLSREAAWVMLIVSTAAFVATTWFINRLCFLLSPVALAIIFFYSLTKRFTSFSHLFLGLALSVSPVGAWLAVRNAFAFPPLVLAVAVLLWVAGFDIIYATQDDQFDRAEGLRSLVVRLGLRSSLQWAQRFHWAMFAFLLFFGCAAGLGLWYYVGLVPVAAALIYEHRTVATLDLAAINRAFFNSNAFVGAVFLAGISLDWLARR